MSKRLLSARLWFAGACLAGACAVARSSTWDVGALMSLLAKHPARAARFVEIKHLPMLSRPVRSTGTLHYSPPDRLEMDTQTPQVQQLHLTKDTLQVTSQGVSHDLSLRFHPLAAAVIDSIRGTLAGNRARLAQTYDITLSGTAAHWKLHLVPRGSLRHRLTAIDVLGVRADVHRILVREAQGERDEITVTDIVR